MGRSTYSKTIDFDYCSSNVESYIDKNVPYFSCPVNNKCEDRNVQRNLTNGTLITFKVTNQQETLVLSKGEVCNFEVTFPVDARPGDKITMNFI